MLVKIIKSYPTYWYNNKINTVINVKLHDDEYYIENCETLRLIKKTDCVIVSEQILKNQKCYIECQLKRNTIFANFLKKHDPDYIPNWNTTTLKHYLYFSHEYKCWGIGYEQINDSGVIYMPHDVCKKLLKKLNSGEMKI